MDTTMETILHTSDVILVAAADSAETDRAMADFVCSGKNDQDTIQAAVDSVYARIQPERRGARIYLLPGNYYIDAFPRRNANGAAAIMVHAETNRFDHLAILIAGSEHTESTVIWVTREAYDSLSADESASLFACEKQNCNHHVFKDLYVTVPDNQKNIVCFDGRFMGSLGMSRCKCICLAKGGYDVYNPCLPVEGFVAFMGTYGSNNMWSEKWEFCQAEGFGQGFAVGSEHLLMHKCTALFGRYGFTFNNYPCTYGAIAHPITLLGCIDECNANLWKFGPNNYRQCINAYNTSFEHVLTWFSLSGEYAKEVRPGDYVGHIDYVMNGGFHTRNDPTVPFWAEGSGKGFTTINNAHKTVCTTAERLSYAANIGQEIYDTDLEKKFLYTGSRWVEL